MEDKPRNDFEKASQELAGDGLLREFWEFLRNNKKWWLMPILLMILLCGLLVLLSGTAVAPFIYTIF